MSADDIIAARRSRIVTVVDARGRTIGVRRIRPSEQLRLVETAEDDADLVPLLCAAAVTFIDDDGARRTCAPDARDHVLWSINAALGAEGLAAVAYAVWQHAAGPAGGAPSYDPFQPFAVPNAIVPRATASEAIASALPRASRLVLPLVFLPEAILPFFFKDVRS